MNLRLKAALILVFLLAIIFFVYIANHRIQQDGLGEIRRAIKTVEFLEKALNDIHALGDTIHEDLLTALIIRDKDNSLFLYQLDKKSIEFYKAIRSINNKFSNGTTPLQKLSESFQAYYLFAKKIYESDDFYEMDIDHELMVHFLSRKGFFVKQLENMSVLQVVLTDKLVSDINGLMLTMTRLYESVALISAILALILIVMITKSFITPIKAMQEFIERVPKKGVVPKICAKLPIEFQALANSFNGMADRLEEQERELVQASTLEAMGRLAGGIAHDFNNILGSIMGCLHSLKQNTEGNSIAHNEIRILSDLCHRGGDLTRKLLITARLDHHRDVPVSIAPLINDLGILLKRTMPKNVDFRIETKVDGLWVKADKGYLLSAILNVATNALDAVAMSGGSIFLKAYPENESSIVISISNTGQGIPDENRDKIFEPFFTTKSSDKGTGLGLSTAIASIESFGGKLKLTKNLREGTEFQIHLPAKHSEEENTTSNISSLDKNVPVFTGKILLVEDEEELGSKLQNYLKGQGFDIAWSKEGNEALDYIEKYADSLRLVLIDLAISGVGGESIAKILKIKAKWIQVVFITDAHGIATNVDAEIPYLLKPFDFDEMMEVIEKGNLHLASTIN